jgi:hypothetical protein
MNETVQSAAAGLPGLGAICLVAALILGTGCSGTSAKKKSDRNEPPTAVATKKTNPVTGKFTLLPSSETGLDFTPAYDPDDELARLYQGVFSAGGIALGDVDNDGKVDVFCVGGPGKNKLYKQTGPFKFIDVTQPSGIAAQTPAWGAGASFVDIDNDSDLDLYVCNYDSANELWINNGKGIFVERAAAFGLNIVDASVMAYFADFDNDRFPDLFLLTNRLYYPQGFVSKYESTVMPDGKVRLEEDLRPYFNVVVNPDGSQSLIAKGTPDRFFHNELGRRFKETSSSAGVNSDGIGMSAVVWDFDNDGDMDIYVCNDELDADCLYENRGRGRFEDVTADILLGTSWLSRGCDVADVNNDGRPDLLTTDTSGSTPYLANVLAPDFQTHADLIAAAVPPISMRNFLHINAGRTGTGSESESPARFLETAQLSGIANTDWTWASVFGDFDNDGFCDLFFTNGHTRNFNDIDVLARPADNATPNTLWNRFKNEPQFDNENVAFRNLDGVKFENCTAAWDIGKNGASYAVAEGDLDLDGDLDLIVMNLNEPLSVYRNDISNGNSLTFQLVGTRSNRGGIGAIISVETGSGTQVKANTPQRGLLASHQPLVQFGLGTTTTADRVLIRWPSGTEQVLLDVSANQLLTVVEPDFAPRIENKISEPRFHQLVNTSIPAREEKDFDDDTLQPNLPYKLSRLGPGIALADANRDGQDDILISAPAWLSKVICLRSENLGSQPGKVFYDTKNQLPIDPSIEEYAPIFFDADGDDDLDLYIVNGGVEYKNVELRLGDSLMVFIRTPQGAGYRPIDRTSLPPTEFSGAAAAVADYDRDGDLDIFVGGRCVRGEYPISPRSMLMRNETTEADQPKFVDATQDDAENLRLPGMVTSALWSDANGDGWLDLLITTEWGPVRLFLNRDGKLVEATQESGLDKHLGWWNGINGRDLDNDGDIDYVVTNFGENSIFQVSAEDPTRIYYGQFGDAKNPVIVESKLSDQIELPVRGKLQMQLALPFIKEKFPTNHDYASAKLADICSASELAAAKMLEANELRTCLLINDGSGKFELSPLPWLAQVAPGFGVVTTDFNADGFADIFIAQNFFSSRQETGRLAGGLSALFLGSATGKFLQSWPAESGIEIAGDAKGAACSDLNNDLRPDLVVAVNNQRTLFFENGTTENVPIAVQLRGDEKNRQAIGARVELVLRDGSRQMAEIYAGGSYLSQSTSLLYFGLGDSGELRFVRVRWPDGTTKEFIPPNIGGIIRIAK